MPKTLDPFVILSLPDEFRRRNIQGTDVRFGIGWASKLVRYFEREPVAASVNYPACWFGITGSIVTGEIEVRRNGTFALHAN